MANFNRIIMIGNLTRDPEYRQLSTGHSMTRLGLASNRQFKNKQTGSMVQEVCYIDIDVWGAQAESCRQYLQKGRPVLVEGRLKFDSWKDNEGQTRSKHVIVADRVVFLGASNNVDISTASDMEVEEKIVPKNQMEKDLLDQIDEVKNRTEGTEKKAAKRVSTSSKKPKGSETGSADSQEAGLFNEEGMNFKDEPPFTDELPF